MKKIKTIKPADFSRKIGVSRARISQLMHNVLRPAIIRVPGKKRVLLDERKAAALFRALADPAKRRGRGGAVSREYVEARVLNLSYQNKILEKKIAEKAALYISKAEIRDKIEKAKAILEKHMTAFPKRMARLLAKEKDEMEVLRVYNNEARKFLSSIIADINRTGL